MNEGLEVIWDESSPEAVAKLRAMNEAGNITWDLVDVVAADAIRLCDEGLAMEIDPTRWLAPAPDGTPASDDFGDLLVSDCFIPQIVYSTTFGYRTDMVADDAERRLRRVRPGNLPGQARAGKAADQQHGMGAATVTAWPKATSTTCWPPTKAGAGASPSSTRSRTSVIWWSAGADTPQLLADGESGDGFDLQRSPVLGDRGAEPARWHALGHAGLRP
jgi:putative spermidine/putrescine transport system substrate-binding protein